VRRVPAFDVIRVQDIAEVAGQDDAAVLQFATQEGRIVVTHDVSTMVPTSASSFGSVGVARLSCLSRIHYRSDRPLRSFCCSMNALSMRIGPRAFCIFRCRKCSVSARCKARACRASSSGRHFCKLSVVRLCTLFDVPFEYGPTGGAPGIGLESSPSIGSGCLLQPHLEEDRPLRVVAAAAGI